MPYTLCPHCDSTVYAGAGWSFRRVCPSCSEPLDPPGVARIPTTPHLSAPLSVVEKEQPTTVEVGRNERPPLIAFQRDRPLRREGLVVRMAPFAVAALGVLLALALSPGHLDPRLGGFAGALTLAILASPFIVPFSRLPRWTEALPPLSYFGVVLMLRAASTDGFSGFEPLVLLPVVWMALYGSRRELFVSLAGASLALVVPLLGPGTHPAAWLHLVVWALVAPPVGLAIFELVGLLERRTREAAERTEALRQSEEATERILGAVGEGVLGVDPDWLVTFANPAGARMLGREPGALVGRPLEELIALRGVDGSDLSPGEDPVGRALSGKEVRGDGTVSAPDRPRAFSVHFVAVPMYHEDRLAGAVLTFEDISRRVDAEEELRANLADLEAVARSSRELSTGSAARSEVCDAVRHISRASFVALLEPAGEGDLVSSAVSGLETPSIRVQVGQEPSGAGVAFRSEEPFFVSEARGHPAVNQPLVEALGTVSALYQPIRRADEVIGVLVVSWSRRVAAPSDRDAAVVSLLAAEAGVAIERADLLAQAQELARTDALTGLANRRALEEELPREMSRLRREEHPLFLASLDLDGLKAYNDRAGHQAGDRLLREAAAAWGSSLRDFDCLARSGGDEFVLFFEAENREEAVAVVERLRNVTPGGVTCSAGLVVWDGAESWLELLERADRALYAAKQGGRDRAVLTG